MSFSSRVLAGLFGCAFVAIAACGGDAEGDDDDDAGDDASTSSSSSSSSGTPSGSSSGSADAGRDAATTSDASTSCVEDLDCNGDAAVSSIQGSCQLGICVCNASFVVQPSGKCGATPAPSCMAQSGTCEQEPAECPGGQLGSENGTNMSCGDLVAAVCCFDAAACKGPVFTCVAPTDAQSEPLCVNGWRTCPAGTSAMQLSR